MKDKIYSSPGNYLGVFATILIVCFMMVAGFSVVSEVWGEDFSPPQGAAKGPGRYGPWNSRSSLPGIHKNTENLPITGQPLFMANWS